MCRAPSRYARRTEARLASRHSPRCVPFSAGGAVQRVRPAARGVAIQVRPLALAARDEPLPIHPLECPPSCSPIGHAFAPCVARARTSDRACTVSPRPLCSRSTSFTSWDDDHVDQADTLYVAIARSSSGDFGCSWIRSGMEFQSALWLHGCRSAPVSRSGDSHLRRALRGGL